MLEIDSVSALDPVSPSTFPPRLDSYTFCLCSGFRDQHEATTSLPLRTAGTFGPESAAKAEETRPAVPPIAGSGEEVYAVVDYEDAYVQPIILSALRSLIPPNRLRLLSPDANHKLAEQVPKGAKVLQIRAYESIDFDHASANPATSLVNSYVIRKALIRKHFLSTTVDHWVAKNPASPLRGHVKASEPFEVDYAEFLDDALDETFDLRASLERNGGCSEAAGREWWILKPSMSDRGQGIRLFSTMEELQGIFDGWEAEMPSSDDEEEENDEDGEDGHGDGAGAGADGDDRDGITTSHLRHFVAQPYIHPPLLLPECGNRKFHIRTYVLCVGALKVYVSRSMLALFAGRAYSAPWEKKSNSGDDGQEDDEGYLDAHLTNTCIQGPKADAGSVRRFWDVPGLEDAAKDDIFAQVCTVTGEVFEAAAKAMMVHFQPLGFAFEVFGLDFLVDAAGRAWLLEVNAFPDFKQTGDDLQDVVAEFWQGAVSKGVAPFVGAGVPHDDSVNGDAMVLVRDVDLGRR